MNSDTLRFREPSIISLFLLTLLSSFVCMLVGYVVLPFAAGLYAALILAESKKRMVLTYILPLFTLTCNFLLNGFYSLEGVAYAFVGTLIFFLYKKNRSKSEAAFWTTAVSLLLVFLSLCIISFEMTGVLGFSSIGEFYGDLYETQKDKFVEFATGLAARNEDNVTVYLFSSDVAEQLFISTVKLVIPFLICMSFVIAGISLKIFSRYAVRHADERTNVLCWMFRPSSMVAYFYLIIFILQLLVTDGIIAESVMWLNFVFAPVFAYMGVKFLNHISSHSGAKSFVIFISIVVIFLSPSFAINLLMLLGVFFTISSNKAATVDKSL